MIIDILSPRIMFNLTLGFGVLTEKQAGMGTSGIEVGCLLGPRECLGGGGWRWSTLIFQPLSTLGQGSNGSSLSLMPNIPECPFCAWSSLGLQTQSWK